MPPSSSRSSARGGESLLSGLILTKSTVILLFLFFGRILASQAAAAAPLPPTSYPSQTPALPRPHGAADADHSLKQPPPQRQPQQQQQDTQPHPKPQPLGNHNMDETPAAVIVQKAQANGQDQAQAHLQHNDQQPPSAYTPVVTKSPSDHDAFLSKGLRQTTFYACRTADNGKEHCGWHVPIVQAAATARKTTETGIVVAVVVCVAGAFVAGMV